MIGAKAQNIWPQAKIKHKIVVSKELLIEQCN